MKQQQIVLEAMKVIVLFLDPLPAFEDEKNSSADLFCLVCLFVFCLFVASEPSARVRQ